MPRVAPRKTRPYHKSGIYCRYYSRRTDNKLDAFYVGSAIDFLNRETEYRKTQTKHRGGLHDMAMKNATNKQYRIVCELPYDIPEAELLLAESIAILLCGSYVPKLFTKITKLPTQVAAAELNNASSSVSNMHVFADRDANDPDGDIAAELDLAEDDVDTKRDAWAAFKQAASALSTIGRLVLEKKGYLPLLKRPTFSTRALQGINVQTPIAGHTKRAVWTRVTTPNRQIFRRSKLKAFTGWRGLDVTLDVNLVLHIHPDQFSAEQKPEAGDLAFITLEIVRDGSRHPHPFARLPEYCPYSDAGRAGTLGMHVQFWRPRTRKWVSALWVQHSNRPMLFATDARAAYCSLGVAIGLLNALEGKSFRLTGREPARPFDVIFRPFQIWDLSYDPLEHKLTIEQLTRATQWIRPGTLTSLDQVHQDLQNLGFQNVRGNSATMPNQRHKCDLCSASSKAGSYVQGSNLKCVSGDDGLCENCRSRGIVCSWTEDILEDESLVRKLLPPAKTPPSAIVEVPDIRPASAAAFAPRWTMPKPRKDFKKFSTTFSSNNGYSGELPDLDYAKIARSSSREIFRQWVLTPWHDILVALPESKTKRQGMQVNRKALRENVKLLHDRFVMLGELFQHIGTQNLIDAADGIDQIVGSWFEGRNSWWYTPWDVMTDKSVELMEYQDIATMS